MSVDVIFDESSSGIVTHNYKSFDKLTDALSFCNASFETENSKQYRIKIRYMICLEVQKIYRVEDIKNLITIVEGLLDDRTN